MSFFNRLNKGLGLSTKLLQQYLASYLSVNASEKQLVLKDKTVALLCQQAINRVEKITNLEPDEVEGLWVTVKHQNLEFKVHFTLEKIVYNDDLVEGQIRLLKQIDCQTDSLIYRAVVAAWKIFLGGSIPNQVLPEGIRAEGDRIYYQCPKSQLQLLDALLTTVENNSALNLSVLKGELYIDTAITWSSMDLPKLIQVLGLNPVKSAN